MRGEYYYDLTLGEGGVGSPPLARGILECLDSRSSRMRITPACAGNTKLFADETCGDRDHPRLRGEYDYIALSDGDELGSPPLARGILAELQVAKKQERITPACAGNTKTPPGILFGNRDHPRLRGEYTKKIPYLQPFPDLHL